MTNKTVSSGQVIAKIYRDLNLRDPNWEEDAIEWIGEALAFIGVGTQIVKKFTKLPVDDFTAELPTDFYRFIELFYYKGADDWTLADGVYTLPDVDDVTPVPLQHTSSTAVPSLVEGATFEFPDGFHLNSGNIITTFEEGTVGLMYYAIETDDSGYPLVPDDPDFMAAFLWYIMKQMMIGGWKHPNPEFGFEMAEQRWLKYCTQARSGAKMPNMAQLDQLARNWNRAVETRDRRLYYFTSNVDFTTTPYGNERFFEE